MELSELLACFILGVVSTASLALLIAELRWRDPIFTWMHRRLF
jgi:hypothetical protein